MANKNSTLHHKICLGCGKPLSARNSRRAYHDDACKMRYFRNKQRQEQAEKNRPPLPEEGELAELIQRLPAKQEQLIHLQKQIPPIQQQLRKSQDNDSLTTAQINILLHERERLSKLHGQIYKGGDIARAAVLSTKDPKKVFLHLVLGVVADKLIGNEPKRYDNSKAIGQIDQHIAKLKKTLSQTPVLEKQLKDIQQKHTAAHEELKAMEQKKNQLEQTIDKKKKSKDIEKLKNAHGMVSAKDIRYISFEDRIILNGDLGTFLGRLEKKRCAITVSGLMGGGKTYLCFDISRGFIEKGFTVAYFSLEEGISDITREKLREYGLEDEPNLFFAETGGLKEIHQAAQNFGVVIIDSWGKLETDISEFDKLRIKYPQTIFIIIFQLTTGGHLRGGMKAAYDSAANIMVFAKDGKRVAQFKKNRYGSTDLFYHVDGRRLITPEEGNEAGK